MNRKAISASGLDVSQLPAFSLSGGEGAARVAPESPLVTSHETVVLEDVSFPASHDPDVATLGLWLSDHALPDEPAYGFWRDRLPQGLVLLPDEAFDFFAHQCPPVVRRVAVDRSTGTAQEGAMWTEEVLPPETLLYTVVTADSQGTNPPVSVQIGRAHV